MGGIKYWFFITLAMGGLLMLSACGIMPGGETKSGEDARSLLEALAGPDVDTMEGTWLKSAHQAEDAGNFQRAAQFYQQLIEKNPDEMAYQVGMADTLRRGGELDKAMKLYAAVLKREPENAAALEGRGLIQLSQGDLKKASKTFGEVMELDKTRWRTLNGVGILFVVKQSPDEALLYFNEALDQAPGEPAVLNNIGLTHAMQKGYNQSISALERARVLADEKTPRRQQIDMNLAMVHVLKGDTEAAEKIAGEHLKGPALYNNLGLFADLAKDEELAKAYLNKALVGSPVYYEGAAQNLQKLKQ